VTCWLCAGELSAQKREVATDEGLKAHLSLTLLDGIGAPKSCEVTCYET
jgi:hypothetical protein